MATEIEALADELPPLTRRPTAGPTLEQWLQRFGEVYDRAGPVIRAWTEAEIVASDVGRLGTDVWAAFTGALDRQDP